MSEAKTNEWILETIDQLRKRRARPDLEKICHMVERKHGLSFEEIEANLNQLVSTGRVNAVVYKGSTSYRNAAKFRKKRQSFSNSPTFCSGNYDPAMLLTTVDTIVNGKREAVNEGEMQSTESIKDTVSIEEIEKYINQQPLQNTLIERNELLTALDKEVDIGTLNKLDSGEYKLSSFIKPHEMNTHANQWAPAPVKPGKPKSIAKSPSDKSAVLNSARIIISPGSGKRGRPPGRRKRIRKSQGAEFEPAGPKQPRRESMVTQDDSGQVALVVRCDFCLMTSDSNRKGEPEKLLVCKDCRAKAHPSCMNYSEELARRARYSPWQCIDCKTCYICEDSGDPDAMLFCDSCDKGYHMNCHRPPVSEKPGGNWVCSKCLLEDRQSEDGDSRSTEIETEIIKTEGPSCLPTPSDSPVSFQQEQKPKLENVSAALNGISAPIPLLAHTLKREVPDASEWSIDEVVRYVQDMGFPMEAQLFQEQEIDGKSLLLMKRCDVLQGLSMKLGPALKIYAHVQRLQTKDEVIL